MEFKLVIILIMRTPALTDPRLRREARTLHELIGLFCRRNHGHDDAPCLECVALETYALERLGHCPYGGQKPVCSLCPSHCYRQRERDAIRRVMRHAGPRLIWSHPLLSLRHIIDRLNSRRMLAPKTSPPVMTGPRSKQE